MSRRRVVVVGLGPAGPELVTAAGRSRRSRASARRFLRTTRHPSAVVVAGRDELRRRLRRGPTLDDGLRRASSTRSSRPRASTARCSTRCPARRSSPSAPSSCCVADDRVEVEVVPALSFLDLRGRGSASTRSRPACASSTATVRRRGRRGARAALVAQCDTPAGAVRHQARRRRRPPDRGRRAPAPRPARRAGRRGGVGRARPRRSSPTTSPSLWIPDARTRRSRPSCVRFAELVRTLRARVPVGPRADPRSAHPPPARGDLRGARGDRRASTDRPTTIDHLEEELGDLLFQVVFHADARRRGGLRSRWPTSPAAIHDKLVRRHPHVFGDVEADSADAGARATGSRSRRPRRAARA